MIRILFKDIWREWRGEPPSRYPGLIYPLMDMEKIAFDYSYAGGAQPYRRFMNPYIAVLVTILLIDLYVRIRHG